MGICRSCTLDSRVKYLLNPVHVLDERVVSISVDTPSDGAHFIAFVNHILHFLDGVSLDKQCCISGPHPLTSLKLAYSGSWVVAARADGTVELWRLSPMRKWFRECLVVTEHVGWPTAVSSVDDTGMVTGGTDGQIILWGFSEGGLVVADQSSGHTKSVSCLTVLSVDGLTFVLSGSNDGSIAAHEIVRVTDRCQLKLRRRIAGHLNQISSVDSFCYSDDGTLVSGGEDGTLRIWSVNDILVQSGSSSVPHVIFADDCPVTCVRISPDGNFIASASSLGITIFQAPNSGRSSANLGRLNLPISGFRSIAWTGMCLLFGLDNGAVGTIDLPAKFRGRLL